MTAMRETRMPLSLSALVTFTDATQALFSTLYDLECARKAELKARLTTELARLDLLGGHDHYADHEDYAPGRDEQ